MKVISIKSYRRQSNPEERMVGPIRAANRPGEPPTSERLFAAHIVAHNAEMVARAPQGIPRLKTTSDSLYLLTRRDAIHFTPKSRPSERPHRTRRYGNAIRAKKNGRQKQKTEDKDEDERTRTCMLHLVTSRGVIPAWVKPQARAPPSMHFA